MWQFRVNFITLHYAYIIFLSILGLVVLYPYGNLRAIDSFFFGASASTESGLNPVDVKELKTYQQLYVYFIPMISNPGFINILVVVVRLHWFEKRLRKIAPSVLYPTSTSSDRRGCDNDQEARFSKGDEEYAPKQESIQLSKDNTCDGIVLKDEKTNGRDPDNDDSIQPNNPRPSLNNRRISFAENSKALYIPSPRERDRGIPILEVNERPGVNDFEDSIDKADTETEGNRRGVSGTSSSGFPLERVASSVFVLGRQPRTSEEPRLRSAVSLSNDSNLPGLSSQATLGRNSQFYNLTDEDRERLGGIEYRSLKLLLKIVIGINTPCSVIMLTPSIGTTLMNVDKIISGVIWIMFKCVPHQSSLKEPLGFLLKYPRRCYTLLFRSRPTWTLFGIIFALNFVDVLLIVVLDLHNSAVNNLPAGPRVLAAIFQAASSRHTGTSSFNLADVSPAVQFSLLVMMYISIFPIAISVRASNTYEERSLGVYSLDGEMDESNGMQYVMTHMRNQLSFDLWYIFLGIFCICIAESNRIMDPSEPAFSVFAIFFEAVSAYGNVGLSLGYPTVSTSFCGQFTTFSKVVVCAMMIRGRHRGLPYSLDRAIVLPNDHLIEDHRADIRPHRPLYTDRTVDKRVQFKRYHTK
ncbi:putative potassium uptake transporter [Aspergillus tanneri]|uniref:Low affinity potassium transporter n=1 Tax=Aspergillus tanneri TaxID=1220188 RepID=A0A5M9MWV6_9EURO|nr:low affinity potassium transporter [Aspergillus tanneri]KAA8649834.1 low affinity potassium transporter [Aspergillus tanneri]